MASSGAREHRRQPAVEVGLSMIFSKCTANRASPDRPRGLNGRFARACPEGTGSASERQIPSASCRRAANRQDLARNPLSGTFAPPGSPCSGFPGLPYGFRYGLAFPPCTGLIWVPPAIRHGYGRAVLEFQADFSHTPAQKARCPRSLPRAFRPPALAPDLVRHANCGPSRIPHNGILKIFRWPHPYRTC